MADKDHSQDVEGEDIPAEADLGEAVDDPGAPAIDGDEPDFDSLVDQDDQDDEFGEADQADEIDQAGEVEAVASPRPVRRQLTQAPVKKGHATRTQAEATKVESKGGNPVTFVKQSVGELKKVVWPSGEVTGQYFVVVLVFVLVLMTLVVGLDTLFGWGLMKWLGGSQ